MKTQSFKRGWGQNARICFIILAVLFSGSQIDRKVYAQSAADWKLGSEKDGIKVFYKVEKCDGSQRILFQIHNNTASASLVDFACNVLLDGDSLSIPSIRNKVEPGNVLEGTCSDKPFQSTFIHLSEGVSFGGLTLTLK